VRADDGRVTPGAAAVDALPAPRTGSREPLDRPKGQHMELRGDAWPPGTWRGRYAVIRGGHEIASREVEVAIGEP
jgi:hypothetical protein